MKPTLFLIAAMLVGLFCWHFGIFHDYKAYTKVDNGFLGPWYECGVEERYGKGMVSQVICSTGWGINNPSFEDRRSNWEMYLKIADSLNNH